MTHSFPTRRSSDLLMGEAQGIDFRVDQLDDRFAKLFPQDFSAALRTDQRVLNARTRLDMSMDAFRHTMTVQSQVVENIHNDVATLADIVARNQGAEGSLPAQRSGGQRVGKRGGST